MIRGCLAQIGCLTLLVLGGATGWLYQDEIASWWEERTAPALPTEPSPEVAERASQRLTAFLESDDPGVLRFREVEVRSLLRYRLAPQFPPEIGDPEIALRDSTAEVSAALDLSALEGQTGSAALRQFVGDSAEITTELLPSVPRPGVLRLRVQRLRAGAVPVPSMMVPWVVRELEQASSEDARALDFPLAPEITAVRVRGGELVFERTPGG